MIRALALLGLLLACWPLSTALGQTEEAAEEAPPTEPAATEPTAEAPTEEPIADEDPDAMPLPVGDDLPPEALDPADPSEAAVAAESTGDDLPGSASDTPSGPPLRTLGIGLTAVKEQGYGLAARHRWEAFAVEGAAALALYSLEGGTDSPCNQEVVNAPFRATASALWFFTDPARRWQHGVRLGGFYDVEFGPGAMAGYTGEIGISRRVTLTLGAGFHYLPDGENQAEQVLRAECGDRAFEDPTLTATTLQPYVGLGLLIYAF